MGSISHVLTFPFVSFLCSPRCALLGHKVTFFTVWNAGDKARKIFLGRLSFPSIVDFNSESFMR